MPYEIPVLQANGEIILVPLPERLIQSAQTLEYAPNRYFLICERTVILPIAALVQTRARLTGIENALTLMKFAYEGKQDRRGPVRVQLWKDTSYLVLDGNSTLTVARLAEWPDLPCNIA
jgi:hypothetical protein